MEKSENSKVCRSTKKIKGCGQVKPVSEFRLLHNKYREGCCLECQNKHRREVYGARKRKPDADSKKLNKLVSMKW